MSDDKKKKDKAVKPGPFAFFGNIVSMVFTVFLAWISFNLILVACVLLYIRLTGFDADPVKVSLAERLTEDRMINLQEIAPGIQTIRHVFRVDTDGDGAEEWVVFYSYDPVAGGSSSQARGPYGAAVYDLDNCRPPAIVTYELRPHNYDYVAENLSIWWQTGPQMYDVNGDGQKELVLHVGNSLSIFRWFDNTQDCIATGPGQRGYQVLGTFRGSGGVQIEGGGRIAILDRGLFERSQTVVKRVHVPDASGSYLRPDGGGLYAPKETGIDFAFGLPVTATQLYYPEKAVLAFYLNLEKNNSAARAYLSESAQQRYDVNQDAFGIAMPRADLARVVVKELRYTPNTQTEQLHLSQSVTIMVVGARADGWVDEANPRVVVWEVVGVPKEGALPYNCEWRLERIVGVSSP